MFQAKKGSKSTYLKGMDEFLQAELEIGQTEAGGRGKKPAEEIKNVREKQLQSVLDLNLLRQIESEEDTMGACS